jgi:serine/threonine protein kinase
MKIAAETAGALAHLHSISTPIIHRDVKTANILLDENYTAKVSDFGASQLVPSGEAGIQTLVLGTCGYLDPEYLQSNQLTEKSDVYSFGVVLVELLTSKVAFSKDRCLASIFVASMEEDCLNQVLDDGIVNEGNIEMVNNVANLAKRCLRVKGEKRPTMKEVAMELEGMRITTNHPWGSADPFCPEETKHLLGSPNTSKAYSVNVDGDGGPGTTSGGASMQIELLMSSYADGR